MSGYRRRPPIPTDSFRDQSIPKPIGGLKAAFERRTPTIIGPEISIQSNNHSNGNSEQHYKIEEQLQPSTSEGFRNDSYELSEDNGTQYSTRIHSIHRLKTLDQPGSKLKQLYEARTGGAARTSTHQNNQSGLMLERHADLIVSKMEQDEALMEDSPTSEQLRRIALRDMPQSLTIKRSVKVKLSISVSQKSKRKPLGCYKMLKYRWGMGFEKFKSNIKDLMHSFELWYGLLKRIEGNFGTGVASFFKILRVLFLVNFVIALISLTFIVAPKVFTGVSNPEKFTWSNLEDVFTGQGYLRNTILYYGFYTNERIPTFSTLTYSMSHAYFFTMAVIYLISFVFFGVSAAKAYRRSFIETEGGLKNVYANKIFCGWDYNIATADAAKLKSRAIFNELRELLSEFAFTRNKESCYSRFLTRTTQFFSHILVIGLLGAFGYFTWMLLEKVSDDEKQLIVIIIPIFVNLVMTFLPMVFSVIVRYEGYKSPKIMLNLTLTRTFILAAVMVGVLVSFWLQKPLNECWETSLGEEIYRIIIFDFIVSVVCAALFDILLFGIYKLTRSHYLEFDIARNTMQIIYNQTLFWVGLLFSPLLPVVVVIKLFLTWYIRVSVVLFLCKASSKSWRAAQTSTWFLVMTFLSLLFVGSLIGFIISSIKVSPNCGPFTNYQYMYEIVTLGVLKLKENSTIWNIILYFTKPGVIALILIGLCSKVYYVRAKAQAQKEIVAQCRNMLIWSAKDKEFWINRISLLTNGQWQYKLNQAEAVDPQLRRPDLKKKTGTAADDLHGI
ncbi:transmembrane channel-like protein 7 [Cylas formicarius]|uniref:transmembrane channel-like protein 7 n=1 Tax=Cylas formicarius TaxID=197179 RepID=UPI0029588575|nr:transmembrane channel-like protein 7 [Cylas formicarius]